MGFMSIEITIDRKVKIILRLDIVRFINCTRFDYINKKVVAVQFWGRCAST